MRSNLLALTGWRSSGDEGADDSADHGRAERFPSVEPFVFLDFVDDYGARRRRGRRRSRMADARRRRGRRMMHYRTYGRGTRGGTCGDVLRGGVTCGLLAGRGLLMLPRRSGSRFAASAGCGHRRSAERHAGQSRNQYFLDVLVHITPSLSGLLPLHQVRDSSRRFLTRSFSPRNRGVF